MRYRIKIKTYENGRQEFQAYVKKWWGWRGLGSEGEEGYAYSISRRESVLNWIDEHYSGAGKILSIDFQYINKSL